MVDRHYSLNLKPWSARTLYVYAHTDPAQKYSVGLQEIFVSRLCSQDENYFFLPCVTVLMKTGLNNILLPILFLVGVNNIVQHCSAVQC
jgi:hypothetical protein